MFYFLHIFVETKNKTLNNRCIYTIVVKKKISWYNLKITATKKNLIILKYVSKKQKLKTCDRFNKSDDKRVL